MKTNYKAVRQKSVLCPCGNYLYVFGGVSACVAVFSCQYQLIVVVHKIHKLAPIKTGDVRRCNRVRSRKGVRIRKVVRPASV